MKDIDLKAGRAGKRSGNPAARCRDYWRTLTSKEKAETLSLHVLFKSRWQIGALLVLASTMLTSPGPALSVTGQDRTRPARALQPGMGLAPAPSWRPVRAGASRILLR